MKIIPITPIWRRYQRLRKASQKERLTEARRLISRPEELADEFAASVSHFSSYANVEDHFYPPTRRQYECSGEFKRTNDVVRLLDDQNQLKPSDAPDRLMDHDAGTNISAVPTCQLGFDYVDRELLPQRTTSPAQWEDGSRNVGGVRLDLLLADSMDGTPIVGELKLPRDTDPFFALVQALTCAAHLATSNQYDRMREHLPRGEFPKLMAAPSLDVWVLFFNADGRILGQRPKGRYMADLQIAAETLAPLLLAQDGIRGSVRRLAGLGLARDPSGEITSEVLWAWGRSGG